MSFKRWNSGVLIKVTHSGSILEKPSVNSPLDSLPWIGSYTTWNTVRSTLWRNEMIDDSMPISKKTMRFLLIWSFVLTRLLCFHKSWVAVISLLIPSVISYSMTKTGVDVTGHGCALQKWHLFFYYLLYSYVSHNGHWSSLSYSHTPLNAWWFVIHYWNRQPWTLMNHYGESWTVMNCHELSCDDTHSSKLTHAFPGQNSDTAVEIALLQQILSHYSAYTPLLLTYLMITWIADVGCRM